MTRQPQTPSRAWAQRCGRAPPRTFALGVPMWSRAGIVFLVCSLISGAARAALADRGAGDRERENTARTLRVYAMRYAVSDVTTTYALQTGLASSASHTHFPDLTPKARGL